jgi:2-oxoglutarate ferredoxin oxidoreductase subunit alpha
MVELPMVIVNIQRGGPSTGLPTKTEQADLLQALYGRHGECPVPVVAAMSPTDCFDAAFEAVRVAVKYMTPVLLLSDGFLANGSKPWKLPSFEQLPAIPAKFWTNTLGFHPYLRDEDTLSRPWVVPGTPGLEHRIGGLEKDYDSGNISYLPTNHERMVHVRAAKVARVADDLPPADVFGDEEGDAIVVGWGSTYGAIRESVIRLRGEGLHIAHMHLRWLNPMPPGVGDTLKRYRKVIVPELNLGQLVHLLRDRFLVDAVAVTKVQGQPFKTKQLTERLRTLVAGAPGGAQS